MESCLKTNQVWEICSGLRPKPDEPLPLRDMIKEDYLALPDKTAINWKEYKVINKRYKIWADSNEKATNLIRRYVNETIQSELGRLSNAKIIWDHLERTYQQNIVAAPYQLFYNLYNMRLTNNTSVTEYLESISRQAGELDQLGWKLSDSIIAAIMVAGLTDRYSTLVSEIKNTSLDRWKSDWVKNRILTYQTSDPRPTASVNFARGQKRKRGSDGEKKEKGSSACEFCRKPGHSEDRCWHKHPEKRPKWAKPKDQAKITTAPAKAESAMHTRISGKVIEHQDPQSSGMDWYVDSAATKHFCKDAQSFGTLESYSIPIEVANGEMVRSTGIGSLALPLKTSDNDVGTLGLAKVIYAPELNANLLSVDQLNEDGYGVALVPEGSEIFDLHTGRHVAKIIRANNLYKVVVQHQWERAQKSVAKTPKLWSLSVWDRRLGHLGKKDLKRLLKRSKIDFSEDDLDEKVCGYCQMAKQTRTPFNKKARRAGRPFELVHTDICGPFPESIDGYKYFVTFTDDYTRYSCTFLLKKKSDVLEAFKRYIRRMKRQFGWKLRRFRSDNGGEYASDALDHVLAKEGIIWEPTIDYSPSENGVSERLNRTLCEKLRALLFESGLPLKLWSRLIETATYLKNRSPTKALGGKTPYEALYKRKPDLSNLTIIGSKAWVAIPLEKLQKLDARSAECRLIGYAASTQYILYQESVDEVIFSRDVVFEEGSFGTWGGESRDAEGVVNVESENQRVTVGNLDRNNEIEGFRTKQELELSDSTSDSQTHTDSRSPSPPSTPLQGDFDAPNPSSGEDTSSESEIETQNNLNPKLQPSISRYGRNRIPSRLLREAEEGARLVLEGKDDEPTYSEAMSSPDRRKWEAAMKDEYDSLTENKTWTLIKESEVPSTHKPIDGKWVFKKKHDGRYKARWVARGFKQEFGVDYFDVFASVAQISSYRLFFALASIFHLTVFQFDVKSAFLNGDLDEEIYMACPLGFEAPGHVCKLLKSIYGLKQAARVWAERLKRSLVKMGFKRLESDHCIYIKSSSSGVPIIIGIYVDDILLATDDPREADEVNKLLASEYQITELGPAKRFLGIEIIQNPENSAIVLHQESYLTALLKRVGMDQCNPKSTPMPCGIQLDPEVAGPLLNNEDKARYHSAVGSIMYAATHTRPDLAYASSLLSRFVSKPQKAHEQALQHVLRYIRGHTNYGISYDGNSHSPYGHTDSDHGGTILKEERKSTSGYLFWLANGPISWSSKRQSTIATSTTEAEYIGQFNAGTEACWIRNFLTELGFENLVADPTVIHGDNQTAITLAKDPIQHSKAKHMDIKYHWQRQRVEEKDIKFEFIPSAKNLADWMTKPLTDARFSTILNQVLTKL